MPARGHAVMRKESKADAAKVTPLCWGCCKRLGVASKSWSVGPFMNNSHEQPCSKCSELTSRRVREDDYKAATAA